MMICQNWNDRKSIHQRVFIKVIFVCVGFDLEILHRSSWNKHTYKRFNTFMNFIFARSFGSDLATEWYFLSEHCRVLCGIKSWVIPILCSSSTRQRSLSELVNNLHYVDILSRRQTKNKSLFFSTFRNAIKLFVCYRTNYASTLSINNTVDLQHEKSLNSFMYINDERELIDCVEKEEFHLN